MLRKFAFLQARFVERYGPTMPERDYYATKKDLVTLENLAVCAPNGAAGVSTRHCKPPLGMRASSVRVLTCWSRVLRCGR